MPVGGYRNLFTPTGYIDGRKFSSMNDQCGVKSRYRPIRIVYLGTGLWNPNIHFRQCLGVECYAGDV